MSGDKMRRYRRYQTPECPVHSDGFPAGTLVHHQGAIYSVSEKPEHPDGGLRGGWGVVVQAVKQSDFTFEYKIRRDRGIAGEPADNEKTVWWASYHINRVRMTEDDGRSS